MKRPAKDSFDGIIALDGRGTIEWANSTIEQIFQFQPKELSDRNIELLIPGLHLAGRLEGRERPYEEISEIKGRRQDGTPVTLEVMLAELQPRCGELFILLVRDVSERLTRRAALEYQVVYDSLTGLPNRVLFYDRLHQGVLTGKRLNSPFSLFIVDLDRFQEVNDSLGHYVGDWVLQQVASRLCNELRESDTVARLGGDEFAVLLPTVHEEEQARCVAEKLLKAIEQPLELDGQTIRLNASLGIAFYPEHGSDAQALIQHADIAMCMAKRVRNTAAIYHPEHNVSVHNLKLKSDLAHAIDNDQLVLHYQPKVEMRTGRIVSAEALVRWQHTEDELLLPDSFIPLAEQTGFIRPLSLWAVRTALLECAAWRRRGHDVNIAVNLSMLNLTDDLPDHVQQLLEECRARAEWLELEITESSVMREPARVLQVLERIGELGVQLSIDDFGTGYSSLSHLKHLPVSELKIDKSFVLNLPENKDDVAIVHATIEMAHALDLRVVAEGVVSYQTWCQLASWDCDEAQGYYISRPLTADQFNRWLDESGPRVDWYHF